ncbi:MotA/TolQ/ExbB proton channel family protein [Thioalkalivibrio nitratireducens DSM 14787]|uniref:MotA/TolQ/ExbB proton channel family protein n=1 Tax=Thioalkalivibrio nitratireducens (strain DSM 14787 / UNIQEM 213 / ALEN2) TaxID=1255043 RepID=L0DW07_THIND|nr:MotA/TolQ/ExbB proton channel family protein [Thioalkalivibrio nitratireducens]AGA32526.1 MotA/TolQ/ExbB proton channel family protein [Thioalkalivibrio nitratireducens DSM 14787]
MLEIVKAGGWLMVPILLCSVIALAIVLERLWSLRRARVVPRGLLLTVWEQIRGSGPGGEIQLQRLRARSPLGQVLAAGLAAQNHSREVMKETIEETGRRVAHELERFLNTLGTIAMITPLLGLLGTVVGMIEVFTVITDVGVGSPRDLAGGISQALVTTATGIGVAIPTLIFHRYFRGRVDELVLEMEMEAVKLVEVIHGERSASVGVGA